MQAPHVDLRGYQYLPRDKRAFNLQMSRLRVTAEWMFRDVACTWSYLQSLRGLRVKQQSVGQYYVVAADLTNIRTILRGGNNTSLYFDCPPPSLAEHLVARPDTAIGGVFEPGVGEAVENYDDVALLHPEDIADFQATDVLDAFLQQELDVEGLADDILD
jgi:hypothetical protein